MLQNEVLKNEWFTSVHSADRLKTRSLLRRRFVKPGFSSFFPQYEQRNAFPLDNRGRKNRESRRIGATAGLERDYTGIIPIMNTVLSNT